MLKLAVYKVSLRL